MSPRRKDDTQTIVAHEPLGPDGLEHLRGALTEALDAGKGALVVDMAHAPGIDGACLSALLSTVRTLPENRRLSVIVSPELARSFAEWRIDTVLAVVESAAGPASSEKE